MQFDRNYTYLVMITTKAYFFLSHEQINHMHASPIFPCFALSFVLQMPNFLSPEFCDFERKREDRTKEGEKSTSCLSALFFDTHKYILAIISIIALNNKDHHHGRRCDHERSQNSVWRLARYRQGECFIVCSRQF